MGIQKYLNGDLRGNGPIDRQKRRLWEQGGYRASELRYGDVCQLPSLEPWSMVLNDIADVGDARIDGR